MVNKRIITKIFDDVLSKHYLWKCGAGGFNKQILSTFNQFREETRDWEKEKCLFVTNKGEIVWSKVGEKNMVELDTYQGWLQSEHNGLLHIEHNHPNVKGLEYFPSVLSSADIRKMYDSANGRYLYRSITAEYPNGSRMSISKTREFGETHDFNKDERIHDLSVKYNNVFTKYVLDYREKILEYTGMGKEEFIQKIGTGDWGSDEFKSNVCKKVTNDIGTLYDYLSDEGLVDEFRDEGLVLKITGERGIYE